MFGKLNRPAPKPQRQRVIPKSAYKGSTGKMLKDLGFHANSPENFVPNQQDYQNKLETLKANEEKFIANINAQLGEGLQVTPWAMVPFHCWMDGPHANFLPTTLDLFPYGPWNCLLLPDTDMGSLVLGMDKNPKTVSQQQIDICNKFIGEAKAKVMAAHAESENGIGRMELDALDGFTKAREHAIAAMMTLAFKMGKTIIGEESFVKSREMFFGDGDLAKMA